MKYTLKSNKIKVIIIFIMKIKLQKKCHVCKNVSVDEIRMVAYLSIYVQCGKQFLCKNV